MAEKLLQDILDFTARQKAKQDADRGLSMQDILPQNAAPEMPLSDSMDAMNTPTSPEQLQQFANYKQLMNPTPQRPTVDTTQFQGEQVPDNTPLTQPQPAHIFDAVRSGRFGAAQPPENNIFNQASAALRNVPLNRDGSSSEEQNAPKESKAPVESNKSPITETSQQLQESQKFPPSMGLDSSPNLASQKGLEEAHSKGDDLQFLANMNRAGAQVAQGIAQTGKLDTSIADAVEKEGHQQVPDYLQQVDFQKQDPNSMVSKQMRQFFTDHFKMKIPENMSAAEIEKVVPSATKILEMKSQKEAANAIRKEGLDYKKERDVAERDLKRELFNSKNDAATGKADKKVQQKSADDMEKTFETSRQPPQIRQANMDNYNAGKANEVLKQYKDLDALNSNDIALYISEISKVAKGGVADSKEFKALNPDTLSGELRDVWQKVFGNPTPKNMGAFLKRYQNYTNNLQKNAQQLISDHYNENLEIRKDDLSPDKYDKFKKRIDKIVGSPETSAKTAEPGAGIPKTAEISSGAKTIVKKGYNSTTNKTQLIYSDGSKEIVDGQQ